MGELGSILATAGDHNRTAQHCLFLPVSGSCFDQEQIIVNCLFHRDNRDPGPNRDVKVFDIALKIRDQFTAPTKIVRLASIEWEPGQIVDGIHCVEFKGFPALGQPGFTNPPFFIHAVVATISLKVIAYPQACLPCTDNYSIRYLHRIFTCKYL